MRHLVQFKLGRFVQIDETKRRMRLFVSSALLFLLSLQAAKGQNNAPPAEWDFDSPSIVSGFELDDNWAYTPIQASDGSIVAVGFSDKYNNGTTGERHPSIFKYIPGPVRKIQWEKIPTFPANSIPNITIANSGSGGFGDVFESNENGTKYVYACGIIRKTISGGGTSGRIPVIAKFYLSTGVMVYFKEVGGFSEARFTRMQPVFSGGTLASIYVAGESSVSNGTTKATIYKLNPDGTLATSFNATGFRQYSAPSPNDTKPTSFKDLAFAPNVSSLGDGYVAVGSVILSGGSVEISPGVFTWVQPDRDVFLVRLRADNGNVATGWPKVFSESSLGATYTDMNSPESGFCGSLNPENTPNEEAWSVKRMPDGNFAVLCRFDFIELPAFLLPGTGCSPFNTEQYWDNDIALVKVNQSTGANLYTLDAGRSVAIDAWNIMATSPGCSEIYISANTFNPIAGDPNGGQILASVIRVDDQSGSFAPRWRKDVLGKHWQLCTFGICKTSDGGTVICGNNGKNGDDYEFIKFSDDRQANFTFSQSGTNITSAVTWNTARTVKGIVTVKSGGTLTIDGATIQLASTYMTNDWLTLSQGGGTPTKIVVETNGKLVLKNGATLKGMGTAICPSGTLESMWEGIVLLGQPTQNPGTAFQGYAEMTTNAKVQNAYVGIHVGSMYYNGDGRAASTGNDGGGIIKCQNPVGSTASHFLNCRRSIWYAPVSNTINPPWQFTNTNFLCDQPMVDINFVDAEGNGRIGPAFMVGSWNRDNLVFNTCTFKSTGTYPEINRGHGVENFDARMTFTGSTFQQLYKGVYAQYGTGVTDPTTLTNCTFTQVRHGGHIVGGAFHAATGNTFQQIPVNLFNDASYGLRFEGSTNLTVSETNTFTSTNSGTYGVIIKDCYGNASEVTRNTFTNVDFGVQTEQNNTGLQIRCNGYTGNDRAWSINPATPPNTPGLFSNQGVCGQFSNQAGNLFNDPDCPSPGVAESHIRSKVNFSYRSRSGGAYNANEIPTCVSNGPNGSNGIVSIDLCGSLNSNSAACDPPCTNCFSAQSIMASANNETEPWAQQSMFNQAITLFLQEGDVSSALQVAKEHFKEDANLYLGILVNSGEWDAAQAKLAEIGSGEQWKDVATFYQVLIELGQNGKSVMDMGSGQEAKLLAVAKGESVSKYAAQNILGFAKGYVFERPVEVWKSENIEGEPGERSTDKTDSKTAAGWLSLMPNPSSGAVEVRWEPSEGTGTLEVFNLNGMQIICQTVSLQGGMATLSLESQPVGVYLVRLSTTTGSVSRKLIKE